MDDDTPATLHRRAWDLIPWVVAGSASHEDQRLVAQHAAGCADCRDEIAFHREVHAAMRAPAAAPVDSEAALQRMMARIDRDDEQDGNLPAAAARSNGAPAHGAPVAALRRAGASRLLACVVIAQAIGLAALAGMLFERPRPADYQTLSRVSPSPASIRLVPAPELQQGQLRALLARCGLQIVESSADGALLGLAPRPGTPPSAQDQILAQLRAEPGVLLAEPMPEATARRP